MNIYFDETVHEQFGFMLLAYVFCEKDPQVELGGILARHLKSEFHALERMEGNPSAQYLRAEIRHYVSYNCRWGVFVLPSEARWKLAAELPSFLTHLILCCEAPQSVKIYLDEGIISPKYLDELRRPVGIEHVVLCKSHEVYGIQLADLVAALSGVRLREEISQAPKMLTYGDESGFDPPIEAELGYELWASLRYSMLRCSEPLGEEMPEMATFCTSGHGLFISEGCSPQLRETAGRIFGEVYLGCIH